MRNLRHKRRSRPEQYREYMRLYMRTWNARRRQELGLPVYVHAWLQQSILRVLSAHPEGLRIVDIRAKLGYRSSRDSIRKAVYYMRRHGKSVDSIKEGKFVRYALGPLLNA